MRSTVLSEAEDEIANGFGEFLFRLRVAPRMDAGWAMDGPSSKETKSSPNQSWEFPGSPRSTARTTEKALSRTDGLF